MTKQSTVQHEPTVVHSTFVLERNYPQSPERVFSAFSFAAKRRRWFADGDQHEVELFEQDFRPWLAPGQLAQFQRHLGIYAYRPEALRRFTQLAPHPLERLEMLEQLRALAHGMAIGVARTPHLSLGVDVPADVPAVEAVLSTRR